MRDRWGDPLDVDRRRAWNLHLQRLRADSLSRDAFEAELDMFLDAPNRAGAERLGLTHPLPPDPRTLPVVDRAPSAASLARVANDISPAAGNDAPDRVLGPWADVLDPRKEPDRKALLVALAASCFVPEDGDKWGRSPFDQWVRRKPHPEMATRDRFRAVARAPASAWRLGDGTLEPLLPIARGAIPGGPVRIPLLASVNGAGAPDDVVLARVIHTHHGWVAPLALALRDPVGPLREWLEQECWLYRVDHKLASVDDLLRARPHVLWRRAHAHQYAMTSPV